MRRLAGFWLDPRLHLLLVLLALLYAIVTAEPEPPLESYP